MSEDITDGFPGLKSDSNFKITSHKDFKYNCIAWAALYTDRWIWPPNTYELDGVHYHWPSDIDKGDNIETFINLFQSFGYTVCDDCIMEENYRKVALYKDPKTGNCTHASRQQRDGQWTSKLGREEDISHSSPYEIEGQNYGVVSCIMKKSGKYAHIDTLCTF